MPRWTYIGKCNNKQCNASIYYNWQEDKYLSNSTLPDHQCTWGDEKAEDEACDLRCLNDQNCSILEHNAPCARYIEQNQTTKGGETK